MQIINNEEVLISDKNNDFILYNFITNNGRKIKLNMKEESKKELYSKHFAKLGNNLIAIVEPEKYNNMRFLHLFNIQKEKIVDIVEMNKIQFGFMYSFLNNNLIINNYEFSNKQYHYFKQYKIQDDELKLVSEKELTLNDNEGECTRNILLYINEKTLAFLYNRGYLSIWSKDEI